MASQEALFEVLRKELRFAGLTYALLAERIGMSESSVKRMFSQGDMTLTRLAEICKAMDVGMDDVMRQAVDLVPHADTLTLAQERALVGDAKLMMVAICCLGQWNIEQILDTYDITEAQCIRLMVKLDSLGLIELKPMNRYRLRVSRTFRWLPNGPVQAFFRSAVMQDYFSGRFDRPGESLQFVHGRITDASAIELVQKIQQLGSELARLHQQDQRMPSEHRDGYTLVVGLSSWEFAAFTKMRRQV
jgi:DNA-binding Xre family transcriptional regulator